MPPNSFKHHPAHVSVVSSIILHTTLNWEFGLQPKDRTTKQQHWHYGSEAAIPKESGLDPKACKSQVPTQGSIRDIPGNG
jgi:hypothetical protein